MVNLLFLVLTSYSGILESLLVAYCITLLFLFPVIKIIFDPFGHAHARKNASAPLRLIYVHQGDSKP